MADIVLHNPWAHFYLLYLGTAGGAFIWDYLRNRPGRRAGARAPTNESTEGGAWAPLGPRELRRERRERHAVTP
jgi:hypothetical protein